MRAPFSTLWTAETSSATLDADPSRRMAWLSVWLTVPLLVIGVRVADLQSRLQPEFIAVFTQTRSEEQELPARNGRILAADGSILADDVVSRDLLVHYRWLEEPPDPHWLRRQAWSRLSRGERRQSALVAAEIAQVQARRAQLWSDLATITGVTPNDLDLQRQAIQYRVENIWWSVNDRLSRTAPPVPDPLTNVTFDLRGLLALWTSLRQELTQPPARSLNDPLILREQEDYHPLVAGISADAAAEIEAHPARYPGVRITTHTRRVYPQRDLATHLLGARQPVTAEKAEATGVTSTGRSGLERQYDSVLQGRLGRQRRVFNRRGDLLQTDVVVPPQHGRDLVLTLDVPLQRRAEALLDAALLKQPSPAAADEESPPSTSPLEPPRGGCLVALDVHTGAILAAAAAPRFDANWLVSPEPKLWAAAAADPRKPFFSRVTQMALPPGSVFKVATAVALLESGTYDAHSSVFCRGYLDRPDQYRCLSYRHYGFGHGQVALADALSRSCNVYFFAGARKAGSEALVEWAEKLGIGQPTGIDVPGETGGRLPRPDDPRRWHPGDTLGLSIGQSSLTVTPLQMARLMAVIANDGFLVTPHLVASGGPATVDSAFDARPVFAHPEPSPIVGLHQSTLAAIRAGLHRAVHDPHGTAYHSVRLSEVAIAGKTGTAEVGGGLPDHAWFAGYVPAEHPRIAFAVVLEHGGSGGKVAGPVAREFVRALLELGLISESPVFAGQ